MPKIEYVAKRFHTKSLKIIQTANDTLENLAAQGFDLTLRQLFYQLVSNNVIKNTQKEYKNLGQLINDARLAGHIDWNHITDRTRNLASYSTWASPREIIQRAAQGFSMDKWKDQPYRVEVWVEKEAMQQIVAKACRPFQVPYFCCKGYTSQSEMWATSQRLIEYDELGYKPAIIHLGDHDPSGIDMTRDITDRLEIFMGGVPIERVALNIDQVKSHKLPPNPTKFSDSRAQGYVKQFGKNSWELDALVAIGGPQVVVDMIQRKIKTYIDEDKWEDATLEEATQRKVLEDVAREWTAVQQAFLDMPA